LLRIATNEIALFCIENRLRQMAFFVFAKEGKGWLLLKYFEKKKRLNRSPRVPLFCSYHILTSSVIYYWTDAQQHGIN